MNLRKALVCATLSLAGVTAALADDAVRVANIINFVRKTEPRIEAYTDRVLYETTAAEIDNMKKNGLRGTILLQYDALIDPAYQQLMRSLGQGWDVGAWWEITQPHVEAAGMAWRGRYPWDWHANVGFATGYAPKERERLVDVYMEKFREIFGRYPASVGSWFIDAHTLKYMADKYHIVAACMCRDQVGTDGYTLWGGYWQGAYYPSVNNAYLPAQTKREQISVPVFRMLGSDPLYQYEAGVGGAVQGVSTLEPVYATGGGSEKWVDWYLKTVTDDPALGLTYFQAGQENSFTWGSIRPGFEMQMPKIAALAKSGRLRVETLEESGRNYRERYKLTPPTAATAMSDYTARDGKTIWFSSRYYRTGLFWEKGEFRFRDIQVYNEDYRSLYLTTPGTSTECHYYALPVVDGCLWSKSDYMAGLRIILPSGAARCSAPQVSASGSKRVTATFSASGTPITVKLTEKEISISSANAAPFSLSLTTAEGAELPQFSISASRKQIGYQSRGFSYSVSLRKGKFATQTGGNEMWRIDAEGGKITLALAQK